MRFFSGLLKIACVGLLAAGCASAAPSPSAPAATAAAAVTAAALPDPSATPAAGTPTPTPFKPATPTATPEPAAARVNGETLRLDDYQAELTRYRAAQQELGKTLPAEADQANLVLGQLVDETLFAQGAKAAGYTASDADLQKRADGLSGQLGGADKLKAWQARFGYDDASFLRMLRRAAAAAWMRDQLLSQMPAGADQVHVQQILVYNKDTASAVLAKLKSGVEFATLAYQYDQVTRGELGWFPRGYLLEPRLDEVIFGLKPGEYSNVVESAAGFHIFKVLERDAGRALSPDVKLVLQKQALRTWLDARRAQSQIELLLQ